MDLECDDYKGFLTGKGNYRNEIATTAPYKGQRVADKPIHFEALRNHLTTSWGFVVTSGIEADDAVAIEAYSVPENETIMVHIDKDLNQLRGWHFNYRKREKYHITEFEGLVNFYTQILTGDRIDNIIGIKGIGPVKAAKILKDCKTEIELYLAVQGAYQEDLLDKTETVAECVRVSEQRILENGQLLWLQRKENDLWQPPKLS